MLWTCAFLLTRRVHVQDKHVAMAEIQRTITRRLSRLPSRYPTLDLDDAQQVQHFAISCICVRLYDGYGSPCMKLLSPSADGNSTAFAGGLMAGHAANLRSHGRCVS